MVVNAVAPMTAGEPLQDAKIEYGLVAAADTFAKGDLVYFDGATDTWKITPTTAVSGDFGVAMDAAVAGTAAKKVRIQTAGRVTVTAAGAIVFGNKVANGTTAGRVVEYTPVGDATDIADRYAGWFSGREQGSDRDGVTPVANAAAAEVIIITLRGRGGAY